MPLRRSLAPSALSCACLWLVAAACDTPDAGAPDPARPGLARYDIATLLGCRQLSGAAVSPDGSKVLFSSNESGVINAYEVSIDGGTPRPLTQSTTDAVFAIRYFPDDERVLFRSDQGGNELDHVFVRERDGQVRDLVPGTKHRAMFQGFAHDRRSFFVASNERDPRYFDVYEYDAASYARTEFYRNDGGCMPGPISRDKRRIALGKRRTTSDSDVLVFDRPSGTLKNVTEHTGTEANEAQTFDADGTLLVSSNRDREFAQIVWINVDSGARTSVFARDWSVTGATFSPDDTYLLFWINADGRTELEMLDLTPEMKGRALPAIPAGDITGVAFSADSTKLAFYLTSSCSPPALWSADLVAGVAREVVAALNPAIAASDLVAGEVRRFTSYDGLAVPGNLYLPHGADAQSKVPALVWVHGGPGGQSRLTYSPLVQFLVNHGYAVYAINNRGSSGYGKSFYAADDRRHGEADLDDVVASKQMLIDTGKIDPQRIGIIGGSYGGYMTLAALAFRPDAFAVGVDVFGVSNWVRTLESIPTWWEAQRQALYAELGDPAVDRERLHRISPLFHAKNIKRPLLVLQGKNDPRVLEVESAEIVAAVKGNGVPVEYVLFQDEGHGFAKRANEATGFEAVLRFLDQHLRGAPRP